MKENNIESGHRHLGCPFCTIVPPHILRHMSQRGTKRARERALYAMEQSEHVRGQRALLAMLGAVSLATPPGEKRRTLYDLKHGTTLPGTLVRGEGDPKTKDTDVNEAYDYSGTTYDFYKNILGRNSVDDRGLRLDSSVHYGTDYDNAFWNGMQMVYGDGDRVIFDRFTKCMDVIGHELTHGVTQYEAGLQYHDQPGALNESFSDVFGSLTKQWTLNQTAADADWLIGAGLFMKGVKGKALRSMAAPGTAYNDPRIGKDPQPAHMKDYYSGSADNGGVHINSGIPNHAFYLVAMALSGYAWEKAGKIWYDALCKNLRPTSTFRDAKDATMLSAANLFGVGGNEHTAVASAWQQVGV